MKQIRSQAIILNRSDYGEADRILTFLTPDYGKVRAIAKAVRKSTSKLAGGIELFSVSDVCFVEGRGDLKTVTSTRLVRHYGNIVKDLNRTNTAYELIKQLDKATEDHTEQAYFSALDEALRALDNVNINPELTRLWFGMQLLKLMGHSPDLSSDISGIKLQAGKTYDFDIAEMAFVSPAGRSGSWSADSIKFLRLGFSAGSPKILARVTNSNDFVAPSLPLVKSMLAASLH